MTNLKNFQLHSQSIETQLKEVKNSLGLDDYSIKHIEYDPNTELFTFYYA